MTASHLHGTMQRQGTRQKNVTRAKWRASRAHRVAVCRQSRCRPMTASHRHRVIQRPRVRKKEIARAERRAALGICFMTIWSCQYARAKQDIHVVARGHAGFALETCGTEQGLRVSAGHTHWHVICLCKRAWNIAACVCCSRHVWGSRRVAWPLERGRVHVVSRHREIDYQQVTLLQNHRQLSLCFL